jgi:hypothetical protein
MRLNGFPICSTRLSSLALWIYRTALRSSADAKDYEAIAARAAPRWHVPIGWTVVGHPRQILSPARHDAPWAVRKSLNLPDQVCGFAHDTPYLMYHVTKSTWSLRFFAFAEKETARLN